MKYIKAKHSVNIFYFSFLKEESRKKKEIIKWGKWVIVLNIIVSNGVSQSKR